MNASIIRHKLSKDAYRCARFSRLPGSTKVLFQKKNVSAMNHYTTANLLGGSKNSISVILPGRALHAKCMSFFAGFFV